jgi:hypothetical protein
MIKILLVVLLVCGLAAGAVCVVKIGPKNIIGMLRYDQRREGTLRVGDRAPDVELLDLDGITKVRLSEQTAGHPSVLVFGSFT